MSKRPSRKTGTSQNSNGNEKKKKILGVFLLLLSSLLLLSMISFSARDVTLDGQLSPVIKNLLGSAGAYLAYFTMVQALGYFSIVIPFLIGMWAVSFFLPIEMKRLLGISNFTLLTAILISSLIGTIAGYPHPERELPTMFAGILGATLGVWLKGIIGTTGGVLVLLALLLVVCIVTFDLSIEKFFHGTVAAGKWLGSKLGELKNWMGKEETDAEEPVEPPAKPLLVSKQKPVKTEKPVPKISDPPQADAEKPVSVEKEEPEPAAEPETKIRIIRKKTAKTSDDSSDQPGDKEPPKTRTFSFMPKEDQEPEEPVQSDDAESEIDRNAEAKQPDQWEEKINFTVLPFDLLDPIPQHDIKIAEDELTRNAELLKAKLALFDIAIQDISVTPGPVVTLYEIVPAPGVKISKIVSLENDIALALAARGIRIIAPIPGKSAIGVEIPNAVAMPVVAREIVQAARESKFELPLALGKTIIGEDMVTDLATIPHLLIAGSTGSGKSVGINMMITSLLYAKHPSDVKLAIIDPKKIELSFYKKLRYHYLAVCPDLDEDIVTVPMNAVILLKSLEIEMDRRYDKLAKASVRNIIDYNTKVKDPAKKPRDTDTMKHFPLPYIVVIIDELADLMITAGKEVEEPIARLAQLARATGIHLLVATQRPSVNVITGVIKANFSARIAYQVATKIDSRTTLDMNGAEQLLGKGDMLFLPSGTPKPIRVQNAYISTDEVERITNFIYDQKGFTKPYFLPSIYEKKAQKRGRSVDDLDELFEEAAKTVVRHQQGSVSLLQRRLKLGYSRAARIMDQLEQAGIVGPNDGSKAREVLAENDEQLETLLRSL